MPSQETIDGLWEIGAFFVFMAGMAVICVLVLLIFKRWM